MLRGVGGRVPVERLRQRPEPGGDPGRGVVEQFERTRLDRAWIVTDAGDRTVVRTAFDTRDNRVRKCFKGNFPGLFAEFGA